MLMFIFENITHINYHAKNTKKHKPSQNHFKHLLSPLPKFPIHATALQQGRHFTFKLQHTQLKLITADQKAVA